MEGSSASVTTPISLNIKACPLYEKCSLFSGASNSGSTATAFTTTPLSTSSCVAARGMRFTPFNTASCNTQHESSALAIVDGLVESIYGSACTPHNVLTVCGPDHNE